MIIPVLRSGIVAHAFDWLPCHNHWAHDVLTMTSFHISCMCACVRRTYFFSFCFCYCRRRCCCYSCFLFFVVVVVVVAGAGATLQNTRKTSPHLLSSTGKMVKNNANRQHQQLTNLNSRKHTTIQYNKRNYAINKSNHTHTRACMFFQLIFVINNNYLKEQQQQQQQKATHTQQRLQ